MNDTANVIEVSGLSKSFGDKKVVDDFAISVPKGAIYGFLGPNGSGKTTTIRMLCGLLTPDAGTGRCLGYDILGQSDMIKEHVGYMTQKFSLYSDLTIRENLDFMARMYNVPNRRRKVDEALNDLGLHNRSSQLAGELSGGWKQRLALAACLLHRPDLLLLDEPTAGVDPKARRDFWDEIRRLSDNGVTVLVSTHYMDEAIQCHNIAYIAYGQKLIDGPAGMWCTNVGHRNELLADTLREQAMELSYNTPWYTMSDSSAVLARRLAAHAPGDLDCVFKIGERFRFRPNNPCGQAAWNERPSNLQHLTVALGDDQSGRGALGVIIRHKLSRNIADRPAPGHPRRIAAASFPSACKRF